MGPRMPRSVAFQVVMEGGMTPLEFMLAVMRDDNVDLNLRSRMAVSAAPYCHPKVMDQRLTQKKITEQRLANIGNDSDWGSDLDPEISQVRN